MNFKINKDNWEKVTLGDVVFEPKETAKDIIAEGFEHIVGLEHIESGDVHLINSFSNDTDTTFTKVFRVGDILFGRRRAYLKKAAQASFDGVCSGDITVMRANDRLDVRLLPFVIHNDKFFDYAVKHSAGGLSPRVKFKDLANYEFLLPPKEQQAELADLLWAMDNVIEKDLEVLERLEGIYDSIISKKLLNKSGFKFIFKENTEVIRGVSFKPETLVSNGVAILRSNNIKDSKINFDDTIFLPSSNVDNKKLLNKNDFAICMSNGSKELVGKAAIISEMFYDQIAVGAFCAGLKVKVDYVDLVKHLLNSNVYRNLISQILSGSTINNLKPSDIEGLTFAVDLEFKEIVKELNVISLNKEKVESKLQSSKALQKALINQIF